MEWKTAITKVEPNKIFLRGYPIAELINKLDYGSAVYLLLKGKPPTRSEGRMMNAILVSTIDHGVTAPSACAARFVASGGSPIQAAVSAGLLAIGSHHGGAIEEAAEMLEQGVKKAKREKKSLDKMAINILSQFKKNGQRVPGFGHPYHKEDPRVEALFALARKLCLSGEHSKLAKEIDKSTKKVFGKKLPMNADGVMAAIIVDMGFEPKLARGFFLISRCAGLVAHAFEEYTREKPFRAVGLNEVKYDGLNYATIRIRGEKTS